MNHEDRARAKKVTAMVAAIDKSAINQRIDPIGNAGQVLLATLGWGEVAWQQIARLANVNAPSATTRELVVAVYRGRAGRPALEKAS